MEAWDGVVQRLEEGVETGDGKGQGLGEGVGLGQEVDKAFRAKGNWDCMMGGQNGEEAWEGAGRGSGAGVGPGAAVVGAVMDLGLLGKGRKLMRPPHLVTLLALLARVNDMMGQKGFGGD